MAYNEIDLSGAPTDALAYAVYTDGVEFGTFDGNEFSFTKPTTHKKENLLELHIFDETKEFRVLYSQSLDKYVMSQIEGEGEHIDEYMLFYGEKVIEQQGNATILEDMGRKKTFYLNLPEGKIYLGVRNYLGYDETGMVTVSNYRLLGLYTQANGEYQPITTVKGGIE
jgi:CRISPR-associated protein (TIGR03984 family)